MPPDRRRRPHTDRAPGPPRPWPRPPAVGARPARLPLCASPVTRRWRRPRHARAQVRRLEGPPRPPHPPTGRRWSPVPSASPIPPGQALRPEAAAGTRAGRSSAALVGGTLAEYLAKLADVYLRPAASGFGGLSSQRASTSRATRTARPYSSARAASSARCRWPASLTGPAGPVISIGSRTLTRTDPSD